MNGDRPGAVPDDPAATAALRAENEALRAEIQHLRREQRRHLLELAQFARIAEGRRPGWPQLRARLAGLRLRAMASAKRLKREIVARMPARLKATLRRVQTRYFS